MAGFFVPKNFEVPNFKLNLSFSRIEEREIQYQPLVSSSISRKVKNTLKRLFFAVKMSWTFPIFNQKKDLKFSLWCLSIQNGFLNPICQSAKKLNPEIANHIRWWRRWCRWLSSRWWWNYSTTRHLPNRHRAFSSWGWKAPRVSRSHESRKNEPSWDSWYQMKWRLIYVSIAAQNRAKPTFVQMMHLYWWCRLRYQGTLAVNLVILDEKPLKSYHWIV